MMISEIKRLSNVLDKFYANELNFRNHCYLRIAFDNTVNEKWDLKTRRPFVKYAAVSQLEQVLFLLKKYLEDKNILLFDNEKSLSYRENYKQMEESINPKLF